MCVGTSDISSPCKTMRTFKSIFVQCPLNLQTIVMTKWDLLVHYATQHLALWVYVLTEVLS